MEDQVRVLKENWIDNCDFINSNLEFNEKKKKLINFRYGESMFLFVSPERLVIEEFRKIINTIDQSDFSLAFSYCVIDEVHCVSEWGHDFRTTYLMLGNNAQKYAKTQSGREVCLIGLTATASFDVLADIERELKIKTEESTDAIISIDNTIRPELFFQLIEQTKKPANFPILEQSLKDFIGREKQRLLNDFYMNAISILQTIDIDTIRRSLEQHFRDFEIIEKEETINRLIEDTLLRIHKELNVQNSYDLMSIIFCPHITGSFGITSEANPFPRNIEVFENLIVPADKKGYFMGGDDRVPKAVIEKAQWYFIAFLLQKITTMVCTKAFGMGINVENIRMVTHINFSSSPESYIQEAGRAGRDKVKSLCTVIFDKHIYYTINEDFFYNNNTLPINQRKLARDVIEEYSSFQNRIQKKYYDNPNQIIALINAQQVAISFSDIAHFNQDKSIHDYFHKNSFKGIQTEAYQLNRLMNYNDGINTTRLKLVTEKYNLLNSDNINLNLTIAGNYAGSMLVNNSTGAAIGKISTNINTPTCTINGLPKNQAPDLGKTKEILKFLVDEWNAFGKAQVTLFAFLKEEIVEGLNNGKNLIDFFNNCNDETFEFTVPTNFTENELESNLENDFGLSSLPVFNVNTVNFLDCLKKTSYNFEDFILRIEEQWNINIFSAPTYNNNKTRYRELYYSDIKMLDVQRMIYRLYSVGFIEDYLIDYNRNLITFRVVKREKEYYINSTEQNLLQYLSRAKTLEIIQELKTVTADLDTFETIKKCIRKVLEVTYSDIVAKRKEAAEDLFSFLKDSKIQAEAIEDNPTQYHDFWFNSLFKEELYYYFNAKYARSGFKIKGTGYSLTDDTENGTISKWGDFVKYAKVLNEQNRFISECKMMRGSCKRIWRTLSIVDYEEEYVLKILYAFATFGMGNKYYYEEAQNYLIHGFKNLYYSDYDYVGFANKLKTFETMIISSTENRDYVSYLQSAKQYLMLLINIDYSKKINQKLQIL